MRGRMGEILESLNESKASISKSGVTYSGYDSKNNGKFSYETKGDMTYVHYQENEFTQSIIGYVKPSKKDPKKYMIMVGLKLDFDDSKQYKSIKDAVKVIIDDYKKKKGIK